MNEKLFSPTEKRVLQLLNRRSIPITIADLTEKFYDGDVPMEANNGIAAAVRRINVKCEHHKLDWHIAGHGMGRAGKLVWKEKNVSKAK